MVFHMQNTTAQGPTSCTHGDSTRTLLHEEHDVHFILWYLCHYSCSFGHRLLKKKYSTWVITDDLRGRIFEFQAPADSWVPSGEAAFSGRGGKASL